MKLNIRKVGVIGAGQMGNGIAHVCALAGFDVLLNDVAPDRINSGIATINGNMARQVAKKLIKEEDRKAALDRIQAAESVEALSDCDLVVETATEKEDVKRQIFTALCPTLKPEAILGTNTSSISITRLASSTDRPERFIGIHFMNPVPLMELVELIRGIATDDQTFEASKEFVGKLGKQVAVSEDFPAFIVNRILLPMINEAIYTLYEGVGNVEAIDAAMKLGAH
ncbi:MAG: 3-hydroxyacyl-CoA dehydrogenase NAD-binding domain-containing protein, partial [Xanthobacteraceae bacterium]